MNAPSAAPIRKVLAAFIAAVIIPGVIGILSLGTDAVNLSGAEWLGIVIGAFVPPLVAYLTPFAKGDIPTPAAVRSSRAK